MKPSRLVTSAGLRRHAARGMTKFTKAALLSGAAAAAIAGTLGMASPANASETSYENAVYYSTGLSGSEVTDLGYTVCKAVTAGKNAGLPAAATMGAIGGILIDNGVPNSVSAPIVAYAVTELCPSNVDYALSGVDGVPSSGGSLYA